MTLRSRPSAMRGLAAPTLGALGLVLALIVGMFTLLVLGARALDGDATAAHRSYEVLQRSAALEHSVIDVETGLRGYLLTRDARVLEPFDDGTARIDDES